MNVAEYNMAHDARIVLRARDWIYIY